MSAGEVSLGTASPEKISVTLEGSQTLLDNLSNRDLELELDTSQAKKDGNIRIWSLNKSDFKVPHWVKIKSFSPGKVQILGYANDMNMRRTIPELTCVRLPHAAIGRTAADHLANFVLNGTPIPAQTLLEAELVPGETTR